MRVAVIGTGIAGNSAAWALARSPHVSKLCVYEKDGRTGGHSATVTIDYDGTPIAVDTGFIVYNELNYPNLTALFKAIDVETLASDMSFAFSLDRGRFEWCGSTTAVINSLFAQRRNIASPRYLKMLVEIVRFNRVSVDDHRNGRLAGLSLGQYISGRGFSDYFRDRYIVPMGAAIWSTPANDMLQFTAENFIAFFDNHKLLQWERPIWRTVAGGSRQYVDKLTTSFRDRIRTDTPVIRITRSQDNVLVEDANGGAERFDHVVIAAHSDQALAMLGDPSAREHELLSSVRYRPNTVYLHRDPALMPKRRRAWAAWNFLKDGDDGDRDATVSYWMNALQGIDKSKPLFVTLNPKEPPAPHLTFGVYSYAHPQFNGPAFRAQRELDTIQGRNRTWFCGAWTGYGFHEDGLASGLSVAESLGARIPWRSEIEHFEQAAE